MGFLLDLIYCVVALVTAPWWLRRSRGGWRERFGRIDALPAPPRPRILLHAVSVGEVNLLRPLVSRLAQDVEVVVSATTDTGIARARQLYGDERGVWVTRYPLDASWAVRRFLNAVRPDAVALVELELWPNFARECRRRTIPLAIINGRLSDRSVNGYRRARPALGRWFGSLAFCAVQDDVYRDRFLSVGVEPAKCIVAGTMKWDAAEVADAINGMDELAESLGIDRGRLLIVAGSTAPDEHALLHAATPPNVQLLCAPRKPEWFDQAESDLPECVRRSRGEARPGADRFLLDTIGELRKAYALADVVVVGRSFGDLYGSDPMEPAALGKPVIIGPSVADFQTTVDTMKAAGAIVQTTRDGLKSALHELIHDEGKRRELGVRARACVLQNQGATAKHAAMLLKLVGITAESAPENAPSMEASHVRS